MKKETKKEIAYQLKRWFKGGKPGSEFNWYTCIFKALKKAIPAVTATALALEATGIPQAAVFLGVPLPISIIVGAAIQGYSMFTNHHTNKPMR